MLKRTIESTLRRFAKFPVVGLFGPRQSGKTTIVKQVFNQHTYLNFEDPTILDFAIKDPKGFLSTYENEFGIILDEFQHFPQILSYIQIEVDTKKRPGYFVLTGSQNFLMTKPDEAFFSAKHSDKLAAKAGQAVTQSLAGRIGILTLLPLSIAELQQNNLLHDKVNEFIFNGGYPRIYTENFAATELYPSYIHTYVERDVRQLDAIENLRLFRKFMQLCAGRIGQLLNVTDLAVNCGINQRTAEKWLSILEASYIIFFLTPHFANFNKQIIKSPKLYFYDTGLACSLLGYRSAQEMALSVFKGPLFECFIIADFYKQYYTMGARPSLYFWRDKNGHIEIDCLIDQAGKLLPIEIKSGQTIVSEFFDGLTKWNELADSAPEQGYLIYSGDQSQTRKAGNLLSWQAAGSLIDKI